MLLGRLPERAALSQLLDAARAGRSGVLVMRGEPGVGNDNVWLRSSRKSNGIYSIAGFSTDCQVGFGL